MKVMDVLASKGLLIEDNVMSRFYSSLLHCLHLVLSNPKGSISEHVAGFVESLQTFFIYGLTYEGPLLLPNSRNLAKPMKVHIDLHIYAKEKGCVHSHLKPGILREVRIGESSAPGFASSDSDHSDSNGSVKDADRFRCSKARISAILHAGSLSADPKSLSSHWNILLPTNGVLQPRKYSCNSNDMLFDPILKTWIAAASTLAAMLDGPWSVFLQVSEYKECIKCGLFTTLSSSLGEILMQLHTASFLEEWLKALRSSQADDVCNQPKIEATSTENQRGGSASSMQKKQWCPRQ